jgi:hypothetical protein
VHYFYRKIALSKLVWLWLSVLFSLHSPGFGWVASSVCLLSSVHRSHMFMVMGLVFGCFFIALLHILLLKPPGPPPPAHLHMVNSQEEQEEKVRLFLDWIGYISAIFLIFRSIIMFDVD